MIEIKRADERVRTRLDWLDSRHSFSFGRHRDPANTNHGLLVVSNDDRVAPGGGFGSHAHNDMEIVTWVLEGVLEHADSTGNQGVIRPGLAQRMSAGSGIVHSEMNHSSTEPVHFVQMWVLPHDLGIEPSYEQSDVSATLATGELTVVASGQGHAGAVAINQPGAVLYAARPPTGKPLTVPAAPHVHVFVARGGVRLGENELHEGDAARLTDHGEISVVANGSPTELLIWATD